MPLISWPMSKAEYLALFLSCFALSGAGTGIVLKFLRRKKIMDVPNNRSNHARPVPRGGGLAVVFAILCSWIYLSLAVNHDFLYVWPVFAGTILLAGVSWVDDLKSLGIKYRLLTQLVAVSLGIYVLDIPPLLYFPIAIAWIWFVNLYNFMDGIDGITGGESVMVVLGIALIAMLDYHMPREIGFYVSIIAAASLGFLIWNWHPARIFIGDVGSVPLGFMLGWLLLELALRGHWAEALLIPAYYLADSGYTIMQRLLKREKIWQAHSEHFYQRAVRAGKTHAQVVKIIIALDAMLIGLAVAAVFYPVYKLLFLASGYGLTALVLRYFRKDTV